MMLIDGHPYLKSLDLPLSPDVSKHCLSLKSTKGADLLHLEEGPGK